VQLIIYSPPKRTLEDIYKLNEKDEHSAKRTRLTAEDDLDASGPHSFRFLDLPAGRSPNLI
jgi:hypothetical protein